MSEKTEIPRVNSSECCGCGLCMFALPDVFRVTREEKAEVFAQRKDIDRKLIQAVMDDCPCMCIHWFKQKS